ncbi:MAG: putative major capsid protein [Prokaryotic dsDNA virus sp.]|nr:MAG: putative major capsid protein [Prokaryotic dsDNA virus sp.]|tara:strand:+ start:24172 stop:25164 length:993 start_codon:yes stop_codon:yes gene_type:complete
MARSYSNLHPVDEILSSLVVEAVPSDNQLIADKVIENITIPERSGTLLLEETRNFMGAGAGLDLERAPGASRTTIGGFDRTSTTFKAKIYAASDSIAMEDIFDSQYPGSEEQRMARKVSRVMKLAREKRCADVLFDSTAFNTSSPTQKYDAVGAEPLTNLHELKDTVFAAAHGINPDTMILGRDVFRVLARNPEIRGYVGTSGAGIAAGNRILNDEAVIAVLRDVLGIPNIHVGQARQDTAVPGATSSESYIWNGETIFMGILRGSDAIVQKSGGVKAMPVAALNFQFGNMVAGQYDSLDKTRRYVYAEEVQSFQAIDSTLGHVLTNTLA